jgi:hypothetical protein
MQNKEFYFNTFSFETLCKLHLSGVINDYFCFEVVFQKTEKPPLSVGQKVVPIDKTVGNDLKNSAAWSEAKNSNTPYLIIEYIDEYKKVFTCNGDFFNKDDLILFDDKSDMNSEEFSFCDLLKLERAGLIGMDTILHVRKA